MERKKIQKQDIQHVQNTFNTFKTLLKLTIRAFFFSSFAIKNINFVGQLFHRNDKTKLWDYIKSEYNLESKLKDRWIELSDALPKLWKDRILIRYR